MGMPQGMGGPGRGPHGFGRDGAGPVGHEASGHRAAGGLGTAARWAGELFRRQVRLNDRSRHQDGRLLQHAVADRRLAARQTASLCLDGGGR